jgi:hypothetical protein
MDRAIHPRAGRHEAGHHEQLCDMAQSVGHHCNSTLFPHVRFYLSTSYR